MKKSNLKTNPSDNESPLPFVFMNVAATADGKIAPADRDFIPFGSKRDQEHLYELRATADAVMSGARTVDLSPVKMGVGAEHFRKLRLKRGLAEHNLRIIVTGSGSIDPKAEIFNHRFSPIIVLTAGRAPEAKLRQISKLADEVKVCGEEQIDFGFALRWLRSQWGVKRLLCEGGGELNAALFQAGLVDELHLTLCPVILGGRNSPTPADGSDFFSLANCPQLDLKSRRRIGDEQFLVYRVRK